MSRAGWGRGGVFVRNCNILFIMSFRFLDGVLYVVSEYEV